MRYAMLPSKPVEHLPCRRRASRLHIGPPALLALDSLHAIKQVLIGFRILNDELILSVGDFANRERRVGDAPLSSLSTRFLQELLVGQPGGGEPALQRAR
jgi:hypothetical protein